MAEIILIILGGALIFLRSLCLKWEPKAKESDAYLTFCIFLVFAALYDIETYNELSKTVYFIFGSIEAFRFIYLAINLAGGKKNGN